MTPQIFDICRSYIGKLTLTKHYARNFTFHFHCGVLFVCTDSYNVVFFNFIRLNRNSKTTQFDVRHAVFTYDTLKTRAK